MNEKRGIDLDEVLFETVDQALQFHNHTINGKKVTKEDIIDYHFYKVKEFGIKKEAAVKWFSDFLYSDEVHQISPVLWAKEALMRLQSQGIDLVGITWRLQEYESWTTQALQQYYANILSKVIYLNAYADINAATVTTRTKSDICKEIGATVMVEDDLHYAQELADNGIKVYLLDKPWNREYHNIHPNIIKVNTWKDILNSWKWNRVQ